MPDIKYVCLSDMHFGAQNSLLTKLTPDGLKPDFLNPSPVLLALTENLRSLISENKDKSKKPTLILLGDILELALCETNEAGMVFDRFIDLILPQGNELFGEIYYIPGNHDHHLWEIAREMQYLKYVERMDDKNVLPPMWHTTNIFVENSPHPTRCDFMNGIIQNNEHLKHMNVRVAYPNFGLTNPSGEKAILFHHGHFLEDIYTLMSTVKTYIFPDQSIPEDIWDIEKENFAWIDFFWSTMGRSGQVGKGVELIYDKMTDDKKFSELLHNIAVKITQNIKESESKQATTFFRKLSNFFIRFIPGRKIEKIVYSFLKITLGTVAKHERADGGGSLSDEMRSKLILYLDKILKRQLSHERKENIPKDLQFVFGHTHKPFAETLTNTSYAKPIQIVNTGGWVVDTVDKKETYGGAVILVDENLNIAPVQMYKEAYTSGETKVRLLSNTNENDFSIRISKLISEKQKSFQSFSEIVDKEIDLRIINLKAKINN
jgi:UDP-2,3-diacylglucosamine pyrophosphatase LpxH